MMTAMDNYPAPGVSKTLRKSEGASLGDWIEGCKLPRNILEDESLMLEYAELYNQNDTPYEACCYMY